MKITFLGTRGYIKLKSKRHSYHTSTLFSYKGTHILFDWGLDWADQPFPPRLSALFLTHAHPDHAWGLQAGAPCPVYASAESWQVKELAHFPIAHKIVMAEQKVIAIGPFRIEMFAQEHSIRCPAVGYRIEAGKTTVYYAGDVVSIVKRARALEHCNLYIGDGSSLYQSLVRAKDGKVFGHASIKTQLGWCKKENISGAIFTHCGTTLVSYPLSSLNKEIAHLSKEYSVAIKIAYDGMSIRLP